MNIFAPEFNALITIFRSTGPVISTRRSCKSFGSGAITQSPSRICFVSGRKSSFSPASSRFWRSCRASNSSLRRASNFSCRARTNSRASGVKISLVCSFCSPTILSLPVVACSISCLPTFAILVSSSSALGGAEETIL